MRIIRSRRIFLITAGLALLAALYFYLDYRWSGLPGIPGSSGGPSSPGGSRSGSFFFPGSVQQGGRPDTPGSAAPGEDGGGTGLLPATPGELPWPGDSPGAATTIPGLPGAAPPGDAGGPLTEGQVWQRYAPQLAELQEKYEGELQALVARGYSDYQRYKSDKKQLLALVPAYIKTGTALEREADAAFNTIVTAMENELRANNLPPDLARDLRRQYRDLKQQKRRQLFDRAWELIHSQA